MKFSIFSKPLSVPGRGKGRSVDRPKEAKESMRRASHTLQLVQNQAVNGEPLASFTIERQGTASDRARAAAQASASVSLEVGDPDNGLSAALENAALLYASGQSDVALNLLAGALAGDPDTRRLPRAWHALFDLLQRAGDRAGFEQLALEYVTAFEASPPPWTERIKAEPKAQRAVSGYFAVSQINVKTALEIPARARKFSSLKIDAATVTQFDDTGCRRMVDVLRRLRRQGYPVVWQGLDALQRQIAQRTKPGERLNEGVWLLDLEILEWQNDSARFDERAVDYAVTFEVSPPSWEPLASSLLPAKASAATSPKRAAEESGDASNSAASSSAASDAFTLKGVLTGPADPQVAPLTEFAAQRTWVALDMKNVDRIDFVCAGALQNIVSGLETAGKRVQIAGASAIVESLLVLIGVAPGVFATR